jgi:hypothetical protein
MVRYPVGGNLLAFAYYVTGLRRLGHEVIYLEESGWPSSCFDPAAGEWNDDPAAGLAIVRGVLGQDAIYVDARSGAVRGAEWPELKRMLRSADLLLNVGGVCWLPEFELCARRALVDMDPVFTQAGKFGGSILSRHHVHFSYGANLGRPGCPAPTAGIEWLPTLPPVVVDDWPERFGNEGAPFTTVAHWSAYGAITWEGERYGQKDEEFLRLIGLPVKTAQPIELAVSGAAPEVADRFREQGWIVRHAGREITATLDSYRAYISGSKGEFSAAKNAYVKTRSGWFSDRTVCYLACGLPAVVQDTGFTDNVPHGEGLIGFTGVDGAAEAIDRVNSDYARHCRAARGIAEERFSHAVVLPKLLERALAPRRASVCV